MSLYKKYSQTRSATSNGMNNRKKAFGLIGLLITLAIIMLASWTTYSSFVKPKNGSETPLEQGVSAISEAEKVKQLLEQRNIITEQDTPNNNIPVVPQNNLLSVHNIRVGDKVGNFTIKSITIFPFFMWRMMPGRESNINLIITND